MPKKKGKAVSFDAMVKFFMRNYDIPTKQDVERLIARIDRLEDLIRVSCRGMHRSNSKPSKEKKHLDRHTVTASDLVLDVVKGQRQGIGIADIRLVTGFDDKKLRNIIFRLNKLGKIKRKSRGIYIIS